jgi:hypothetical protein
MVVVRESGSDATFKLCGRFETASFSRAKPVSRHFRHTLARITASIEARDKIESKKIEDTRQCECHFSTILAELL